MALTIAELRFLLDADTKGVDRGLDHVDQRARRTQGVLKTAAGTMSGFLGANVAVSALDGVKDFFTTSIRGASDLQQSIGGVEAVFGKYASGVERDARRAAQELGLSTNAYNELITVSAAMLKNKGLKDFADQSRNLLKIGADLSAQYGGPTKDAVDALNAAMRGESDPIEKYGISLNETAVNAILAAKGQSKLTGASLELAKTQARLELITRQSADAHGAFAREADTAAGKQQRSAAAYEDTKDKLGNRLLPVMTSYYGFLNTKVVPALDKFVDGMQDGTGAGGDFADVLANMRDIGEGVVRFFDAIPGPVKKTGLELAVLGFGLSKIGGGITGIRTSVSGFITDLKTSETTLARVGKAGDAFGGALRNIAGAGGLLAVQDGLSKTNRGLGTLETTLGGALAGFSVGGPIGAAVGALGGLAVSVLKTGKAAKVSIGDWTDYVDTLDDVTGATTKATRQMVFQRLQDSKVLEATRGAGLTDRQVVAGIMNGGKARERVVTALKAEKAALDATIESKQRDLDANLKIANDMSVPLAEQTAAATRVKANRDEIQSLKDVRKARGEQIDVTLQELGAVDKSVAKKEDEVRATITFGKALKQLPDKKETQVRALSLVPTTKGVAELARQLNLTPDEVATVIKSTGAKTTVDAVQRVMDKMAAYAKLHPTATVDADTKPARDKVSILVKDIKHLLSGNFTALVSAHTTGGGGGGGGRAGSGGRFAGGRGSSFRGMEAFAGYAGLTGTPLEILQQQQTIRDIQRDLNRKNKKGKFAVRGLDRQVLAAQLDEARAELGRLMSAAVAEVAEGATSDAVDAATDAAKSIADQLKQSQSIFSTGTTSAAQLLKNRRTDVITNSEWASLLASLSTAGLSKTLIDEFIANGPSTQALKLGKSILKTGNIADLNATSSTLAAQNAALGAAGATGNLGGLGGPLFTIDNFNAYGMTPEEVASRLYFTAQVQR